MGVPLHAQIVAHLRPVETFRRAQSKAFAPCAFLHSARRARSLAFASVTFEGDLSTVRNPRDFLKAVGDQVPQPRCWRSPSSRRE